jgi:hypothetical protein
MEKELIIPKKFLDNLYLDHKDNISEYFDREVESDDYEAIEQFLYEYEPSFSVYMVEVGIELENKDKEFEAYKIEVGNKVKNWKSLYDENVIAFTDEQEAKDYIDEYVKDGVKNTYGFMWTVRVDSSYAEFEDLFKTKFLEGENYDNSKEILYFKGGKK